MGFLLLYNTIIFDNIQKRSSQKYGVFRQPKSLTLLEARQKSFAFPKAFTL